MYVQVARKLVVSHQVPSFSQAVSMERANAISVESTCFYYSISGTNTKCTITAEVSNDLENWTDISGATDKSTYTGIGDDVFAVSSIAGQFVRLRFEISADMLLSGTAIFAAGVQTANM